MVFHYFIWCFQSYKKLHYLHLLKNAMHSIIAFIYNEKLSLKSSNSLTLGLFKAFNDNRIFYQISQLSIKFLFYAYRNWILIL